MEQGTWFFILKFLPYVAFCSIIAFFIGLWFSRPKAAIADTKQSTTSKPNADETVRFKNLQEKLQLAEADARSLRQEISQIKSSSIAANEHQRLITETESLRAQLDTEKKRIASLEADLRKAQSTSATLNTRLNQEAKSQSSRLIALENELSKAREALNAVHSPNNQIPEDDLRIELERAKETATNAIRLVGEARKREAALQQELETLKNQRAEKSSEKIGAITALQSAKADGELLNIPSAAQRAMEQVKLLNEKRAAELAVSAVSTSSAPLENSPSETAQTPEIEATNYQETHSLESVTPIVLETPISPQDT